MARKRRAPSPPPPPQEESSSEESGSEELEEPPRLPELRSPPQAAANNADSSEADTDSDTDAQAFQMRQANKEKMLENAKSDVTKESAPSTANQSGDSQKASKKGQARLSEEATTTASPSKSKKQESHNGELNKDDGNLAKGKKGKTDKGKMDIDMDRLTPKEPVNANQNGGIVIRSKEGEINDEGTEGDANVQGVHRRFGELQKLYSNLAVYVEEIETHHPCGETLKRVFEFIADEKAEDLESKIKKLRVAQAKAEVRQGNIKKEVLNLMLSLVD
uniref:Uncharacterized protein n=1 Tax=Zea mays TaxID=4577 RepID=A0A804P269_MAIZE